MNTETNLRDCEVYQALNIAKNFGLTNSELYAECEGYSDKREFSKDLNKQIKANLVVKRADEYWSTAVPMTERTEPLKPVKVRKNAKPTKYVPIKELIEQTIEDVEQANLCEDKPADKVSEYIKNEDASALLTYLEQPGPETALVTKQPAGRLHRTMGHTRITLLLFYNKTRTFTFNEIKTLTKISYGTLYSSLKRLTVSYANEAGSVLLVRRVHLPIC